MNQSQPDTQNYLAVPPADHGPGVLVLHAWWGLNDFFQGFCDRLAAEGFVALAPDMFKGDIARTVEEAEQHLSHFKEEQEVPPIVLQALEELRLQASISGHGIGVVGFSMGAYWALWLAQKEPELIRAVVLFYGTNGGGGDFKQSKAAFQGHFAENDPYESEATIRELEKNLKDSARPTTFYTYHRTGHWFFEQDRPDTYNEAAASLAWERMLKFLRDELA